MAQTLGAWLVPAAVVLAFFFAIRASDAQGAYYKMVTCAGLTGAAPYWVQTNTATPQNPAGIFEFQNGCAGAGGDPPGSAAFMRIVENQAAGNAGVGAWGIMNWDSPPFVHFLAAGGYTREPYAFNEGWRARFWAVNGNGGATQLMTQGAGLPNSGGQWATTGVFAPHLWPVNYYGEFHRFVFELGCVRPSGCDRVNYNAADANGFVFILSDNLLSEISFYNTNSALLQGSWVSGPQAIGWNITEQGSGLRLERVRVDGLEIDRVDFQAAGACSTSFSQTNGEAARSYSPCPVGGPWPRAINYNTAAVGDGAHTLTACSQDYAQYQGLNGTGSETCDARTIYTDNSAPGAPSGLRVTSANPQRYLDRFDAQFSLPPNHGSPIRAVHYDVINAADEVVQPKQTLSGIDPTQVAKIQGPKQPGNYRLRVWLEDSVGLTGPAATAPVPRDTTPPAAPQGVAVAVPTSPKSADGFDVTWRNIVDAGSPIQRAQYQVLSGSGAVVVPTQRVNGDNVEGIQNLEAPNDRGGSTLKVWLEDAEGNVGAPVSAQLAYNCVKSPSLGGQQLSASFGDAGEMLVPQGEGATLSGELHGAGGGAIAAAPLCIFSNVVTDNDPQFLGIAVTGSSGAYRFAIAPGASRKVTSLYRPGSRELSASAILRTKVKPTLKARSLIVRNKGSAFFKGEIPGPHNNQVVIVLQVKSGKGWLTFRRYRTRNDGRYELEYTFHRTTRPTIYKMRAQVRQTTGYPYEQGDSDPLLLRVVPGKAKPVAKQAKRCPKGKRAVKKKGAKKKTRCVAKPKKKPSRG